MKKVYVTPILGKSELLQLNIAICSGEGGVVDNNNTLDPNGSNKTPARKLYI